MREQAFALAQALLFRRAPVVYRAFYSAYKALSDRDERRVYAHLIRPGMTVADIGANIGVCTEIFARYVGPTGHVHAFEPEPENFRRLRAALGHHGNVTLNDAAVAQASGSGQLHLSEALNVDHRLHAGSASRQQLPIRVLALDDYFPAGQAVDFIKMDIQGAEFGALCGMRRVLAQPSCKAVLFEYFPEGWRDAGARWADAHQLLAGLGFGLHSVDRRETYDEAAPAAGGAGYFNVLALRA